MQSAATAVAIAVAVHSALKLFINEIHSINDRQSEHQNHVHLRVSRALQRAEDLISYQIQLLARYGINPHHAAPDMPAPFTPEIMHEFMGADYMFTSQRPSPSMRYDFVFLNMLRYGPPHYDLPSLRYRPSGFQLLRTHECLTWPACEDDEREKLAKNQALFVQHLHKANNLKLGTLKQVIAQKKEQQQREYNEQQLSSQQHQHQRHASFSSTVTTGQLTVTADSSHSTQQQQHDSDEDSGELHEDDTVTPGLQQHLDAQDANSADRQQRTAYWFGSLDRTEYYDAANLPDATIKKLRDIWYEQFIQQDLLTLNETLQNVIKDAGWLNLAHKKAKQTLSEVRLALDNTPYSANTDEQPRAQSEGTGNAVTINPAVAAAIAAAVTSALTPALASLVTQSTAATTPVKAPPSPGESSDSS